MGIDHDVNLQQRKEKSKRLLGRRKEKIKVRERLIDRLTINITLKPPHGSFFFFIPTHVSTPNQ